MLRRMVLGVVAGLVVGLGASTAAIAQSSMSVSFFNESSTFAPELTRSDLDVFKRVLSLRPEETSAMEDLYIAYAETLRREGIEVRRYVAEVAEEAELLADNRILTKGSTKLEEWKKRSDQVKKVFIDDLKSLLTKDQESRWPIVERELRRLKQLGWGRIPGESVDLVKMMENVPEEAKRSLAIGTILEQYSQELDVAIKARGSYIDKHSEGFEELVKQDANEAERVFKGATRERAALAAVNAKFAPMLAAELKSPENTKFEEQFFKLSYPRLAKATRAEKYINGALKLKDLNAEQTAQVTAIVEEYDRARREFIKRAAEAEREFANAQVPLSIDQALGRAPKQSDDQNQFVGYKDDHPIGKLRKQRLELDRAARRKLDAVLTPEQRAGLPDSASEAVMYYNDSPWGL